MHESPHISETESEVMKLLWQKEPLFINEIISELTHNMQWSDQTIKLKPILNKPLLKSAYFIWGTTI
ncbi:BlaI/MecI/CopY family transcriptional regulator [Paenibacillus sp. UMB7766-LJ446]|uniref:BlaI/MecI/CopY family transcriptional regulator n=1 Tax=Paenibacillus sp. UMB7766-LJ446 TaxID=3046313 RepID=UPI00254A176A|nr:BlaI/MecI/CopY family transcriptional regulator [Paenibacillus sp. UMB7766-LJ446]MDK8192588.1 BlaI/MecI/CopY family transcriptional regulator [Paenibacillus sp. UMB7766-LJ446]